MSLRAHITHILAWWNRLHPSRALDAIPGYREARQREEAARRRNDARAIGRARQARREALHRAMAGGQHV